MPIILFTLILSLFISIMLTSLALMTGKKSVLDREKLTSFECGFDSKKKARAPFSLRFFIITILFLIFDIEVTLLLPLGFLSPYSDPLMISITASVLTLILILGIVHEWNQGALAWVH
uniref:NADH-ubiquinone oxidoreductase chain 3 n=1 Tax=Eulimnogammarus verrucosus TaxID=36941 RepID=V5QEF5_EULVE|nr:NADH dehydrogenase subunit 3 [Eulimnogammarus verrucosus]AHB14320.1 NADH dehydrogenase subunit 3 [Eulimnogammarus verrucosus]